MKKIILLVISCFSLSFTESLFAGESESIEILNSGKVLPTTLPFSEAVRVGNLLYLSGQIGVIPGSMKLVTGGIKEEATQTLENKGELT